MAVFTVNNLSDAGAGSLRDAIDSANAAPGADTILFEVAGTLTLASALPVIAGDVTLDGDIGGDGIGDVIIDANADGDGDAQTALGVGGPAFAARRVLDVAGEGTDAALSGLTLTGGVTTAEGLEGAGGGVRAGLGTTLELRDSAVEYNATTGDLAGGGGGIAARENVTLTASTVASNTTAGTDAVGGGLYAKRGTASLTDSLVAYNTTEANNAQGGGLWAATAALSDTTVKANRTFGDLADGGDASVVFEVTVDNYGIAAGQLSTNGGPSDTIAILAGGLADNSGDPATEPAEDQRGVTRDSAPDLGAFELASPSTPPVAIADLASVDEDGSLTGNVLANDVNPEGRTLLISLAAGPQHGALQLGADGEFIYTPDANFFGSDAFSYVVSDGVFSDTGAVSVDVGAINDAPSFAVAAGVTVLENAGPQTIEGFVAAIAAGPSNGASQSVAFVVATSNDDLFAVAPAIAEDGTLTFSVAPDTLGNATVTVTAIDDGGTANGGVASSASQSFLIKSNPLADAPSLVVTTTSDTFVVDGLISLREALFFANDDPDASTITFAAGIEEIVLTASLPSIVTDVVIDGGTGVLIDANADGDGDAATAIGAAAPGFTARRVFDVAGSGTEATFKALTITGGFTVADGSAGSGGGIRAGTGTQLLVEASTLTANATSGLNPDGGGLFAADATLRNATVAANRTTGADASGGGVAGGNIALANATLTGNQTTGASAEGGGLFAASASIENSLVVGNAATNGSGNDLAGTFTADAASLVGGDAALIFEETVSQGGVLAGQLADHGGPTSTVRIVEGGLADGIGDLATVTAVDQRGTERDALLPDIGAFEQPVGLLLVGRNGAADTLIGGLGNDTLKGLSGTDFHDGGPGIDTVDISHTAAGGSVDLTLGQIVFDGGLVEIVLNVENIVGSQGDNRLIGTTGDNVFDGQDGTDTVVYHGVSSSYSVSGPAADGAYTVTGPDGTDTLINIEQLRFADTSDLANGDPNADQLLIGGIGPDVLIGAGGNDTLRGLSGTDFHDGGAGIDTVDISHDTSAGDIDLTLGVIDYFTASEQALNIENLIASDGNNRIVGTIGDNILDGRGGTDTVVYDGVSSSYSLSGPAADGSYTVTGPDGTDTLIDIEQLRFADTLDLPIGDPNAGQLLLGFNAVADTLIGGPGNDTLKGLSGTDFHDGAAGIDTVDISHTTLGGSVDLTVGQIVFDGGLVEVVLNVENIVCSQGDNRLIGTGGDNVVDGQDGTDTVVYGGVSFSYSVSGPAADGSYTVTGTDGTDTLIDIEQLRFADTLDLPIGDPNAGQLLLGSNGVADTLIGSLGNETLKGLSGADFHDGGGGIDTVDISHTTLGGSVDLTLGQIVFDNGLVEIVLNVENIVGSQRDNRLIGTGGDNVFDGQGGTDTVVYGGVSFSYSVSGPAADGSYTVTGPDGTDTLIDLEQLRFADTLDLPIGEPNVGQLLLGSNGVADTLIGGPGVDTLQGLGGIDFHDGGPGSDTVDISHTASDADIDLALGVIDYSSATEQALAIENLIATGGDNRITGTVGDNVIDGRGGTDTVLYAFAASA